MRASGISIARICLQLMSTISHNRYYRFKCEKVTCVVNKNYFSVQQANFRSTEVRMLS
jgi:hypothetical protein